MRHKRANPDAHIAAIASGQFGVVSIRQLRDCGLDQSAVKRRVHAGRLHRLHRGVYAVGHMAVPAEGRWLAATLAIGRDAVLSHRAAAELWRLLPGAQIFPIDISVPGNGGRAPRRRIRLHRCISLDARAVTRRLGIPVTTPARTIVDLRPVSSPEEVRRAMRQADVLGLSIAAGEHEGVPTAATRSELESLFLDLCRRHGLPPPEANVRIAGLLVDFAWKASRLIVETDGYRYHRGRTAFEDDRVRDLHLRNNGYEVIRLTHEQVTKRPREIAGVLKKVLRCDATT